MIFKNKLSFRQVKRSDNWLLGGNQLLEALKKKSVTASLYQLSYSVFHTPILALFSQMIHLFRAVLLQIPKPTQGNCYVTE